MINLNLLDLKVKVIILLKIDSKDQELIKIMKSNWVDSVISRVGTVISWENASTGDSILIILQKKIDSRTTLDLSQF